MLEARGGFHKRSTRNGVRKRTGGLRKGFHYGSFQPRRERRERRNFQNYVISKLTQNHLFFTSFTSNYSFFTLLTLPLWLSTPPYPHLPLFYPPSRLDGYSTGTRRVATLSTLPVITTRSEGLGTLLVAPGKGA